MQFNEIYDNCTYNSHTRTKRAILRRLYFQSRYPYNLLFLTEQFPEIPEKFPFFWKNF